MRRRLVWYFDRKRCAGADDLADETLNRVARRLEEEGTIAEPPARYCYIVAKFVLLEHLRHVESQRARVVPFRDDPRQATAAEVLSDDQAHDERLMDCLERCLQGLAASDRDLILEYYRGEQRDKIERRRRMAAALAVTANALSIRACRIRDKLETCIHGCRTKIEGDVFRRDSSHRRG